MTFSAQTKAYATWTAHGPKRDLSSLSPGQQSTCLLCKFQRLYVLTGGCRTMEHPRACALPILQFFFCFGLYKCQYGC